MLGWAHEAKRNLEVQVNNRTVAAIVLDGKGRNRVVQVPLSGAKPKDGYLKLAFLYSGAVTPDHCIDVRYVGDSLIIRPETAVEVDVGPTGRLDVPTTAALMPRDVGVFLPSRHLAATELATALTVGRALITSGRRVTFYNGYDAVTELAQRDEAGRWAHGIVLVGTLADVGGIIDSPIASVAGDIHQFGMIDAVRVRGLPALVIADADSVRAARLFGTPMLAAMRAWRRLLSARWRRSICPRIASLSTSLAYRPRRSRCSAALSSPPSSTRATYRAGPIRRGCRSI
jgi:hypothetical protein